MNDSKYTIVNNAAIAKNVYRMLLVGETDGICPGQFVNIQLSGKYLRRPISVCDAEDGLLTIIYKVVGDGTAEMSRMVNGTELDLLTCLGQGYDLTACGEHPLLIGGGVGVPPLYMLAKRLMKEQGVKTVDVVLGFNTAEEVFYAEEFAALGCEVTVCTADGSKGVKGFVTDAMPEEYTHYYACGPLPMLKALSRKSLNGEVSMEERMGCGWGVCMGCSIQTTDGTKRVCKEGPVFRAETIIWNK